MDIRKPLTCMMSCFRLYLLLFLLVSCKDKRQPVNEVLSLKELNELVTVEYVVSKIIKANDDQTWYKPGDRKILMTCEATLKAGIDFSAIRPDNISVTDKDIRLVLPRATLFSVSIPPENIKVAYEEVGVFRSRFSPAERDALATQAQQQIVQSADSLGILAAAEANASLFVSNFLKKLGYRQISIHFDHDGPAQRLY